MTAVILPESRQPELALGISLDDTGLLFRFDLTVDRAVQREAGEAYVKSQREKGWVCLPEHYDDGGYSGGTIKRPALEKLMKDVRDGKIDVVVVYKIDRLSRSLADCADLLA